MKGLTVVLASALALASGTSPPQDFIVSDHLAGPLMLVHGTGADHTLKILFLGDGFMSQDASIGAYRTAVDEMTSELLATEPFSSMKDALSIYRMDVISDGEGIDVPETCPDGNPEKADEFDLPPPAGEKSPKASRYPKSSNNALDTTWCAPNVLTGHLSKIMLGPAADSSRVAQFQQASEVGPNITIVLVNDFWFGASAYEDGDVVYLSIGRNLVGEKNPETDAKQPDFDQGRMRYVFVHEIAHLSPFKLLDEYSNDPPRALMELLLVRNTINDSPNLSTSTKPSNWAIKPNSEDVVNCASPAPRPEVGLVPGGYGFDSEVYHAQCSCRMNESTTSEKFCPVCRERIRSELATKLPPK